MAVIRKLTILSAITTFVGVSFVGCGDDSDNKNGSSGNDGVSSVETMEDLVHCTKSHYGDVVYVEEKDSTYECTSEDWIAIDSQGSEKSSSSKGSSSSSVSAGDTASVAPSKVESVSVSGFAHKGPFASGSAVAIYGLNDDFSRSKNKYTGKVAGDSGSYSISGVSFDNQYAEIEVNGFYANPFTGKATTGTKTKLTALVDLGDGKAVNANINLFTEFEKARALYLIEKENLNFPTAKKRAGREVIEVFAKSYSGITIADDDASLATDISLMDTSAAAAALYAAGVMMTGKLSISKSATLISDVASDIAKNGKWKDAKTRATVADNLVALDSADGFAEVRSNLKSMKLSKKVPDFESLLRYFWANEYGFEECTSKLEEQVKVVSNTSSSNDGEGFACTSNRWHKVSALDAELGLCTTARNGKYEKSSDDKFYICKNGSWMQITEIDYELKVCTAEREAEFKKYDDKFYYCSGSEWSEVTELEKELNKVCDASTKRDTVKNESNVYYACDGNEWSLVPSPYGVLGFCDSDNFGKAAPGIVNDSMWICESDGWKYTKNQSDYNVGLTCNSDRVASIHNGYVCEYKSSAYTWRKATSVEISLDSVCTKASLHAVYNKYTCSLSGSEYQWRSASAAEIANKSECYDKSDLKYKVLNGYVCVNKVSSGSDWQWRSATDIEKQKNAVCTYELYAKVNDGYTCRESKTFDTELGSEYYWDAMTAAELATGKVKCSSYEILKGYACVDDVEAGVFAWRKATEGELATGVVCGQSYWVNGKGVVYTSNRVFGNYACVKTGINASTKKASYAWRIATSAEKKMGRICTDISEVRYVPADTSAVFDCKDSVYTERPDGYAETIDDRTLSISYTTSVIGGVAWMTQNLRYEVADYVEQDVDTWCGGNDKYSSNKTCPNYGRLYSSLAASRSICPSGWRLPTTLEVQRLSDYLEKTWTSFKPQYAGYYNGSSFMKIDQAQYIWIYDSGATPKYKGASIYGSTGVMTFETPETSDYGYSIRCVKNYSTYSE